jgi:hypothetical protein
VWVFLARRHEAGARAFAMLCALIALDLGLIFDLYTTHWFPRLWIVSISLTGSLMAHLALVFPQRPRVLNRTYSLRYLVYVPAVILAVINQFTILNLDSPVAYFDTFFVAFAFISVGGVAFLAMMFYRGFFSESPIVKAQARTILLGALVSFVPIAVWQLFFESHPSATAFVLPWMTIFPLSVAYVVLRYRLFNISRVVSRVFAYVLLSAAVVGVYVLLLNAIHIITGATLDANNPLILGIILVLALLLNPVWVRLQRAVNRVLMRRALDT